MMRADWASSPLGSSLIWRRSECRVLCARETSPDRHAVTCELSRLADWPVPSTSQEQHEMPVDAQEHALSVFLASFCALGPDAGKRVDILHPAAHENGPDSSEPSQLDTWIRRASGITERSVVISTTVRSMHRQTLANKTSISLICS